MFLDIISKIFIFVAIHAMIIFITSIIVIERAIKPCIIKSSTPTLIAVIMGFKPICLK